MWILYSVSYISGRNESDCVSTGIAEGKTPGEAIDKVTNWLEEDGSVVNSVFYTDMWWGEPQMRGILEFNNDSLRLMQKVLNVKHIDLDDIRIEEDSEIDEELHLAEYLDEN